MHNIIVPYHNSNERNMYLANACYEALCTTQTELKQENEFYRQAVRMRKHALTQSLSAIEAMFYSLNSYREKHDVLHNEDNISRKKRLLSKRHLSLSLKALKT
jgi:hypothetical protein